MNKREFLDGAKETIRGGVSLGSEEYAQAARELQFFCEKEADHHEAVSRKFIAEDDDDE